LDLKKDFHLFEWPTTQGDRWRSIYSPHLKRAIGGIFHRTSLVDLFGSRCKFLEADLIPDKSSGGFWKSVGAL
jgi:hypothetical protein